MIKNYLENDFNFNKLHNTYLINTDDTHLAFIEVLSFLSDHFYENQEVSKHPDFYLVQKLDGNVKNISVEQIRNLQTFLNKTSMISGKKSAIIYDADQMNINASNCCLKILEDPPKDTYIFLITSNSAAILPTIRSRSAKINNHFHSNDLHNQVEDYYVIPFLKTTKIDQHLSYLKDFAAKDRDLWVKFTANAQNIFSRIIKKLNGLNIDLSDIEKELLTELINTPKNDIIQKYNKIIKLSEDTIKFDLELKASYLKIVIL